MTKNSTPFEGLYIIQTNNFTDQREETNDNTVADELCNAKIPNATVKRNARRANNVL